MEMKEKAIVMTQTTEPFDGVEIPDKVTYPEAVDIVMKYRKQVETYVYQNFFYPICTGRRFRKRKKKNDNATLPQTEPPITQ